MKIRLRKGQNLKLAGAPENYEPVDTVQPELCAICPDDFPGFVPKAAVAPGDTVSCGSALMYDKKHPELKLISPISGTVRNIVRGERRKIQRIEITASGDNSHFKFESASTPEELKRLLANSGLMAMMRQRPFDIVPDPDAKVRDIFVTALDTAPLAAPTKQLSENDIKAANTAVKALATLTEGKVYVCYGSQTSFPALSGAEMVSVEGSHPAGNAGVQIANIKPVNKGETVWTLTTDILLRIGRLLLNGTTDTSVEVTVAGSEVSKPAVIRTVAGAEIRPLVQGRLEENGRNKRIISGNVLTGTAVSADSFLRAPYRQITVIAEGDDVDEFMGWASISPSKMSSSRSFPLHYLKHLFKPDARLNGGRRAMIMSGEYDSMIPMDIMPEYLIKAILAKDIEKMEELGIYEVAPEDFALAEYADTSKLPLQKIVRDGLDHLRKELE